MTRRTLAAGRWPTLTLALFCTACDADSPSKAASAAQPVLKAGTDEGAMADLQASPQWAKPRCRWLQTGTWILAYRQETALYEAARDLGYVNLEAVGTANRIGTPETAWKVTLTDSGKAQAAACGSGSSRPSVWGLPVSARRFISGTRIKEPDVLVVSQFRLFGSSRPVPAVRSWFQWHSDPSDPATPTKPPSS